MKKLECWCTGWGKRVRVLKCQGFFRHLHSDDWVTGTEWSSEAIYSLPGVCEEDRERDWSKKFQMHTHMYKSNITDTCTSAEASDVTSIRFSARKANTAAARTGIEGWESDRKNNQTQAWRALQFKKKTRQACYSCLPATTSSESYPRIRSQRRSSWSVER